MKLRVFYDLCPKAGLTPVYGNVFSTMLTGEASDYYYQKVSGVCATFDAMVYAVRTHFETEERCQRVTTEWEDTNLVQIRDKNTDKSLMECFELMKNQLIHDQQILRPELQTDTTIRDKIYRAVRMVPECNLATFKPTITFQAACEDIRNAISIRSQTGVPQAFVQDEDSDDDGQHGSFYTDRRFHGQKKRWERPTRGGQRGGKLKPGQRQKICFVCKKVGCRSTNHTEKDDNLSNDSIETRVSMTRKFTNVLLSSKARTRTLRKITSNSLMNCNLLTMKTHPPETTSRVSLPRHLTEKSMVRSYSDARVLVSNARILKTLGISEDFVN